MNMNNVKETNVDNVIPFRKPKSGLQEPLIHETLIRLNDYLKRINKYSIRELEICYKDGLYEKDGSGVFNVFEIGEPELRQTLSTSPKITTGTGCHYKCWFSYDDVSKMCEFVYSPIVENPIGTKLQFRKNAIRDDFRRKKLSIWIVSNVFSSLGEEVLDDIFYRGVFNKEHNITLYD